MIDTKKYLDNYYKGNKSFSLDAMKFFIDEYKDLEEKIKFIHIAGTNGKGSCTEMISNILVCAGYKVGKVISPHLIKYNERMVINGKEISDEELSDLIEELEPKIKKYNETHKMKVTLFELENMLALLYFYKNNVEIAVIETGLGGLQDSTNVISKPLVSVITSIGYDHMHILGRTLPEIAEQKAGIIKENSSTVFFEQTLEVNQVFINECKNKNNQLQLVKQLEIKNHTFDENMQYFDYGNLKHIAVNLKGAKQIQNASICLETINILNNLGYTITEESIRKGLSTVVHKARMEVLSKDPLIIYDGAHNEPAIENLKETVKMYYSNYKRRYVISILRRKDYKKMIQLLLEDTEASFILTSGNDAKRFATSKELYEVATKYSKGQEILQKSFDEAIEFIMNNDNYANFIVGSFHVYGTTISKLNNLKDCSYE